MDLSKTPIPGLPPGESRRTWITEPLALEFQKRNKRNRRQADATVLGLADMIDRGEWIYNADPIAFDWNGELLNGQHRLAAIILAGKPVEAAVVWGLDPRAFVSFDSHKIRSQGDCLGLIGEGNLGVLSPALTWIWKILRGKVLAGNRPSRTQAIAMPDTHPGIRESVALARTDKSHVLAASMIAALHYLTGTVDKARADEFFALLTTGIGLSRESVVWQLRERAMRNRIAKRKLNQKQLLAISIKAWNAFFADKPVGTLRWTNRGDTPEEFPKILGLKLYQY